MCLADLLKIKGDKMKFMLREILIFFIIVGPSFLSKDDSISARFLLIVYPCYVLIRLLVWLIMVLVRYYRRLKKEQKPLLNKTTLSVGVPILALLLILTGYDFMLSIGPTAIVIDAETGKPVEGAVALAQWYRFAGSIPEGGAQAFDRAKESYSDKDGKVFIDAFWGLYFLKPSLTVYKPGYVLWNSKWLCPTLKKRFDFDENNRTVKLLKFDAEAPRWMKEYPDRDSGLPRSMQDSFFNFCYSSNIPNEIKIRKIFYDYELPLIDKEELSRRAKEKLQSK